MMRALVLTPDRDHDSGDYTGAFAVEADRLLQFHGLPATSWVKIDVSRTPDVRRQQVLTALRQAGQVGPLDLVAFLCHGWRTGVQLGFDLVTAPDLGAALAGQADQQLAVALYCCSTGDGPGPGGDGGFADLLRDVVSRCVARSGAQLDRVRVDAHASAGHCCSNPFVRRFEGAAAAGGAWLVEPESALWPRWVRELSDRHGSTLRFRYPLLHHEELARALV